MIGSLLSVDIIRQEQGDGQKSTCAEPRTKSKYLSRREISRQFVPQGPNDTWNGMPNCAMAGGTISGPALADNDDR
ncbi:hypothetical protein C0V73_08805 [Rhizobium sp. TH135]|nr:hypothetical protein C0V73_08805 [Rhizobium sp. TH135]